jgi:hypothetical protein
VQWTEREVSRQLQTQVKTLKQQLRIVVQRWYFNLQPEGKPREA